MASAGEYPGDYPINMRDAAPAWQVNKHDAKDRFCYDGCCILHGLNDISIKLNPENNPGRVVANFAGPDGRFQSGLFGQGRAFEVTFTNEGRYAYYCSIHPMMTCVVIVVPR